MTRRYPPIEPHEQGMLDVGDGHRVHWEVCGNPRGKPAVVLHGGPGSGCAPAWRRYFDPERYRIVLFDQRGSGRSTPSAALPEVDLSANTTEHLLRDIEALRRHLSIERWLVLGASWGATLGLAYAQRHPGAVSEVVLFSVTNTTAREVEWITRDMGRILPERWERFRNGVPADERDGDLAAAYSRLLHHTDADVRDRAARDWCDWEDAHVGIGVGFSHDERYDDPEFRLAFARLVTHYWSHAAWIPDGQLSRDAHRLAGIPGTLVHGLLDISGPADIAWNLARSWPDAELILVDRAGHGSGGGIGDHVIAATDKYANV
ncbi:MAG TPA: prolyl aminopeptidase [Stackebrandtia sp.]|jgi:proline iminopeptidase|uniref:prolyl aminopeptidase n=1 Tax=Stackebrandtia sp. TaxID=2023065 RepID=UPI002D47E924|nr:prolyl aminopeptidase [Stackebrandtia sp.]HZE41017.1 prolyl aminopeptidase [Stackebrandtia sp.]